MGHFILDNDAFCVFKETISTKISGACISVMRFLLLEADKDGKAVVLRGQLENETGLSRQTIRSALAVLERPTNRHLTSEPTTGGRLYVIENYEGYNAFDGAANQPSNQNDRATVSTSSTNTVVPKSTSSSSSSLSITLSII